jgi:phospholipid/cholesterol/gamma-HCH transport system ATP-binding protein
MPLQHTTTPAGGIEHAASMRACRETPARVIPLELCVERLSRAFGTVEVLRGIDLSVRRGELVAIVGPSGCGKTVLLKHCIGSLSPDQGRVLLADHEAPGAPLVDLGSLTERGLDRIRRHWAVVFQHNALFSGTVYENCALWLREVANLDERLIAPRVRRAISAVGLDPDKVLDKDRDELSGGMAKRVAIARAVAMEPALVFHDEPTTGLDPRLASQIHELISTTHHVHASTEGRTTVIVTHDKDLLRRLEPRVVMLNEGRVFFDGPFDAFARSRAPHVRPYFEQMPALHHRREEHG